MNVWLVTPAWQRLRVTELALAQRRHLCDVLAARGVTANSVIVADDGNLELAERYGFDPLEFPNDVGLGAKFNAGFTYALEKGADYIVHIGSDDWVHPDFFDPLPLARIPATKPMPVPGQAIVQTAGSNALAAGSMVIANLQDSSGIVFPQRRSWGIIPWAIPREAFELHPDPIQPSVNKGIEMYLYSGLSPVQFQIHNPHIAVGVDWKSSTNITPMKRLRSFDFVTHLDDLWKTLSQFYPEHLVDMARETAVMEAA